MGWGQRFAPLPNPGLLPPPKGWQCPKCGACWNPAVDECRHCEPKPKLERPEDVTVGLGFVP